jgi:hypothetical protein
MQHGTISELADATRSSCSEAASQNLLKRMGECVRRSGGRRRTAAAVANVGTTERQAEGKPQCRMANVARTGGVNAPVQRDVGANTRVGEIAENLCRIEIIEPSRGWFAWDAGKINASFGGRHPGGGSYGGPELQRGAGKRTQQDGQDDRPRSQASVPISSPKRHVMSSLGTTATT